MLRVAVLSCYRLLSASLSSSINNKPNMSVTMRLDDWDRALDLLTKESIDVLLMEVSMTKVDHLAFIRNLLKATPDLKILILNSYTADNLPSHFLEVGAKGILCRKDNLDEVILAINEVARGNKYLSQHYMQQLGEQQIAGAGQTYSKLSKRELQILLMITTGKKVGSICDTLDLSPKTVNTYRYRIFSKLGLDSDVSLARWAIRQGLIEA